MLNLSRNLASMTSITYFWILIIIIVANYLFEQYLDYLNYKSQSASLPSELKDVYNEEKYLKSIEYNKTRSRFSFITSAFSFLLSFILLYSGFFGWLDALLRPMINNEILLSLAYFMVLFIVSDILNTPLQWYSTFVIEEKFGFNKTTPKLFIVDKFKGYLLSVLLGGLLGFVLLWLIHEWGQGFWWIFWVFIAGFMVFMNMFYTSLIVPLFNKLLPLEDGELKEAIQTYARSVKFPLDNIYVIDGSKRSSKANAYFSGIGRKKKIVLYDTLIENHTEEELVSVLAHEVGHFKKNHIYLGLLLSILQTGLVLFIMAQMIFNINLSLALGGDVLAIHLNLIAFGLLFTPISKVTGLLFNVLSRKNEFEADQFASLTYDGNALINALKKLSSDNLSNLTPSKLFVFFNYSHPPLLTRLEAIRNSNS